MDWVDLINPITDLLRIPKETRKELFSDYKETQIVKLKQGIDKESATKINKLIKSQKLKVQSQIQGDQLRVTGKKIDDLQKIIQIIKEQNMSLPIQFINMRS